MNPYSKRKKGSWAWSRLNIGIEEGSEDAARHEAGLNCDDLPVPHATQQSVLLLILLLFE